MVSSASSSDVGAEGGKLVFDVLRRIDRKFISLVERVGSIREVCSFVKLSEGMGGY